MATTRSYAGHIAAKLGDFRARAQKEASKNRPPPSASSLDQYEAELKSEAEGWMSAEQALFDMTLTESSRSATEASQKAIELRNSFDQLLRDDGTASSVEAELAGERQPLVKLTEDRLRLEAEISYFRQTNAIHEEARYPDSRIWHFGILAILAVIEVSVNAFFYENSEGLLGGVTVAAGVAVVNMVSALGLGYGFRYKNLAAVDRKAFGWMCFAVFALSAVFFNAIFAAFRSEYQLVLDPTDARQVAVAFQKAWPQALLIFRGEPHFQDHWSFILFGLGLLSSIVAFWKGYTLDDKYPGYGAKAREYKDAVALENARHELVRQKVKEMLHHKKAALQAAIHEPGTQVGMLARRIADLEHARGTLDNQTAAVRRDYSMVIEAYRQANLAIRSVAAPAYFSERAELSTRVDSSGAARVNGELTNVQKSLETLAGDYRDRLNDKLRELQTHTSEILNRVMGAYLQDVRSEAEDAISRGLQVLPGRVQVA
jgi:hypothetical protein